MAENPVTSFTIKRSEWLRGLYADANQSALFKLCRYGTSHPLPLAEPEPRMCCLGFAARACGLQLAQILNVGTPGGLFKEHKQTLVDRMPFLFREVLSWHQNRIQNKPAPVYPYFADSEVSQKLMNINDDNEMSDATREDQIKTVFGEHGIVVEFVD